jgi:hypothetical protein
MGTAGKARPAPRRALQAAPPHPFDGDGEVVAPVLPSGPPPELRTSALNVKIRPSVHRKLRHLAVDAGRPVAEIIDELVGEWVERQGEA